MPFRYRLQSIMNMKERAKAKQEQVVNEAAAAVRTVEAKRDTKILEQINVRAQRMEVDPMMLNSIDKFLVHIAAQILEILEELAEAKAVLKEEEAKLSICRQEVEALEKHKEKAKEVWKEEEKAREMKQLDEVASQRYFRQMIEAAEEAREFGEDG